MNKHNPNAISFDTAKEILSKLKSGSIPVTVWHVFPKAECRLNGFILGNNQDALLVRTRVNDDSGPFMASYLARKAVRCVHYRCPAELKMFGELGENVLGFFFTDGSKVHVYYNSKLLS